MTPLDRLPLTKSTVIGQLWHEALGHKKGSTVPCAVSLCCLGSQAEYSQCIPGPLL